MKHEKIADSRKVESNQSHLSVERGIEGLTDSLRRKIKDLSLKGVSVSDITCIVEWRLTITKTKQINF